MLRSWMALLLLLLAGPALAQADSTSWFTVIADNGDKLGHATSETADSGRRVREYSEYFVRIGDEPRVRITSETVFRRDEVGRIVSIASTSRTGNEAARTEARIEGEIVRITRDARNDRRRESLTLPAGTRFDSGAGLLAGWDPVETPRLEFNNFNVGAMAVERVVIEPGPAAADGRSTAIRWRYEGDELRGIARLTLGADGDILIVTQPMFGTGVTLRETDRETALAPFPPYRILQNAMVRAPFRIPGSAREGHIRYSFAFRDGLRFTIPETGEQRAAVTDAGAVLDICEDCGPGLASDEASLADALRATAWLQSDHHRLRAIAVPISLLPISDAEKMELLRRAARPYIEDIDFAGHFSALETMARRAGDCTEAAVLLAALGRAAGIPTRVASGLVYSREQYHGVTNTFMPHSWTLAWVDGAWHSFDLALDYFDSTHIALTIGDGDARSIAAASQLASLLEWQSMTEVRPRPTE